MGWKLEKDRPIYLQLVEELQSRIVSGDYPPGTKIASVRELAADAAVNPNTMQRALAELEQSGLLRAERTSGRFVTEDTGLIAQVRWSLGHERIESFVREMLLLGYDRSALLSLLREVLEETEDTAEKMNDEGERKHG